MVPTYQFVILQNFLSSPPTMKSIAIIFLLIFGVCVSEKARFDFYRIYEVSIDEEIHLELLRQIEEFPDGVLQN